MMDNGLSTADAVLLTDRNRSSDNGNGGMWGDGGFLWIFFLFFLLAWGNGGWGFGNGGSNGGAGVQGALTRGDLCMDMNFQELANSVRGIGDGIARLGYELCNQFATVNSNVNLGFSTLNSTICNAAYENAGLINGLSNTVQSGFNAMNISNLQTANAQNIANLQSTNAIQTQIADCCCTTNRALDGINYNMATNTCAIENTLNNGFRDVIDSNNAGVRAILDKMCAQEIAAKDAQIAAQNQRLFAAELAASQAQQNQYLINQLRPTAVPAYLTCSPYASAYGLYNLNGYGNSGCGCGCGCN